MESPEALACFQCKTEQVHLLWVAILKQEQSPVVVRQRSEMFETGAHQPSKTLKIVFEGDFENNNIR